MPRIENETYAVTEKIDGTNACVIIKDGEIAAQSRTRIITPQNDNFGFAAWVEEHKKELLDLGDGYHYGEWWGQGIQRNYGLDHKRFSLFNWWMSDIPECCHRIPLVSFGMKIDDIREFKLKESLAAPGFTKVEGLVIKSNASNQYYKVIWDK